VTNSNIVELLFSVFTFVLCPWFSHISTLIHKIYIIAQSNTTFYYSWKVIKPCFDPSYWAIFKLSPKKCYTRCDQNVPRMIFFTQLWVHFGTPLFAGWCRRTPSLPGTRDGPSMPLSPLWALIEESRVPAPCYCSCRAGCRKSKSSACVSSFVWNWEEMVQRHLKCWELPSVSSVWAVLAFLNGTRFKECRDSVDDNSQSGRPLTSKTDDCVARVWELIWANRRLTIRELSVEVGVSYGTCQAILTQHLMSLQNLFCEFSLPNRGNGACLWQQTCCRKQSGENFMGQIIMGDKAWVCGYDPETKRQSSQWKSADF